MNSVTDTANDLSDAVLDRMPSGGFGKGIAWVLGLYLLAPMIKRELEAYESRGDS